MKCLVLPPHRDVTLVPEAPDGWHCVDVARDFYRRVFAADEVEAAAKKREDSPATAQSMRELLLLRSAQSLWAREGSSRHTALRAQGAVLTAISGPPCGVHLRLDDVALDGGTTERSVDVLRAMDLPAAYADDLTRAVEQLAGAEHVRLWLERDLQLPAAAWLARACPAQVPLEVAGPFAAQHREVLARLPVFQRAVFVDAAPLRWRVTTDVRSHEPSRLVWIPEGLQLQRGGRDRGLPADSHDGASGGLPRGDRGGRGPADPVHGAPGTFVPEAVRGFTGGDRWAGHVSLESLLHPDALVDSGCEVAIVGFCAFSDASWLDPLGGRVAHASLAQGTRRLRDAGVRVVAEWWLGAPGVDEAALDATFDALDREPWFDHVAGVRPFHWTRAPAGAERPFLWRDVRLGAPPEDRDLARSLPFEHARAIPESRLPQVLTGLANRLLARAPLSPGRVAAACLPDGTPTWNADARPRAIVLDADCALVQLPASLDGAPRPSWYATNLRTGGVLAMDARLAPALSRLTRPREVASVLGAVPEAQREKLVDTLVARAVLMRVNG
ncbi:hypothetical protein [Myxococcus sp. Y35]|uniref:hypothetical protein n=1 Tax=Pseudomyxococcus flavus TaxID=3115648 RepID=UPI003CE6FE24